MPTDSRSKSAHSASPLCRLDDIVDGGARGVGVERDEPMDLVLLRRGEQVFAYHNVCTHAGRNLDYVPGKFLVREGRIICPVHGSTFEVESGNCCGGPAAGPLHAVPVRVIDGEVWLADAE